MTTENDNLMIGERYLIVDTDNAAYKETLDVAHKNIDYFFSAKLNTKEKIRSHLIKIKKKLADIRTYHAPEKDRSSEYSDVKNRNYKVYEDFIDNLVRKAHARRNIAFVNYISDKRKSADLVLSYFFDTPKIGVTYFTSPVMLCFSFNREGLNIVYMLNHHDNNKMMLDINMSHNNEIISTEVYFNGNRNPESEMIKLNHMQLDYLIVLSHYADGENIDFIVEKYVDDILVENYQNVLDYFKIKEMLYI